MRYSRNMRAVAAFLALLPLAACSLAPDYERPAAPVPAAVSAGAEALSGDSAPENRLILNGWREFFKDERLAELIALSLEHNRELKIALLEAEVDRARYGLDRAELFPMPEAGGSANYAGEFWRSGTESFELALMIPAYELDFFGRLRSLREAAWRRYLSAAEEARAVKVALVSRVAGAYLAERLADELLGLARETLKSRRGSLAFIRRRVESGQSGLLDLEQARSMVEEASALAAMRERELALAENELRLRLGIFDPPSLPPGLALRGQGLAPLPAGVASELLLRRPDILAAEQRLRAANADIGAARAAFFPSISLTGRLGYMSEDLSKLFAPGASAWSFMPALRLPIFSGGRDLAALELAELGKEKSVLAYEQAVQNAFREVADALRVREGFAGQYAAQERFLSARRQVLELAMNNYANGAVSYLEVLEAQRGVLQAEEELLGIRRDQLMNEISLYAALGGGLDEEAGPDAAP